MDGITSAPDPDALRRVNGRALAGIFALSIIVEALVVAWCVL